jgi:CspA family cold shock protein
MKGTVKWYNSYRGYGFIQSEDGKEVFVHKSSIEMETDLYENDPVEFEIEESDRGPKAMNVMKQKAA